MGEHFTQLGNHMTKEAAMNNAIALSANINSRFRGNSSFKKKPRESPMTHLKRVCFMQTPKKLSLLSRTTLERACIFLAIFEQMKIT